MRVIDYSQIERRRQRQASRRRRVRRSVIFLAILVLLSGYGYLSYQRPLSPAEGMRVELKPAVHTKPNLVWPAYGQAAIGSPNYGVLDESGDQTPTPTASTAKIMTALAVLNQKPFKRTQGGPILTMTDEDVAAYTYYSTHDGSFVPVAAGEQLNEYQALEAMLLPSANNMAETLARWAFGSTDAYVQYANSLATELGMRHTHIADASGFSPDTTSTAHDLAILGLAAMAQPTLAEIVSETEATIPVAGGIHNTNFLLGRSGVIGLKTGNTNEAGGCFIFAGKTSLASGQSAVVVGAIMAAPSLGSALRDAEPLLASAYAGFGVQTIAKAGQTVGSYAFKWGAKSDAVLTKDATSFGWLGNVAESHVQLDPIQPVQNAPFTSGTITVATPLERTTIPLSITSRTSLPSPWWRLWPRWL